MAEDSENPGISEYARRLVRKRNIKLFCILFILDILAIQGLIGGTRFLLAVSKIRETPEASVVSEEASAATSALRTLPEAETERNEASSAQKSENEKSGAVNGVSPEFKAMIDAYEDFFDNYVSFMNNYMKNPTDMTLLLNYAKFIGEYEDAMKEIEDIKSQELSPEDYAYYIDFMGRLQKKMLNIIQ